MKVYNLDELRRLLSKELYGTRPYVNKNDWEVPFLQAFVDQDRMIDLGSRSEIIDIKKKHYRNKFYASLANQSNEQK